jgi:hypothetical protein
MPSFAKTLWGVANADNNDDFYFYSEHQAKVLLYDMWEKRRGFRYLDDIQADTDRTQYLMTLHYGWSLLR